MVISPLMKEFQPKEGHWEDWQAFEGACEEVTHVLLLHIMKALKRKPETMYSQRRVNPLTQKAQAEQTEEIVTKQEIQKRLRKMKAMLSQFDDGHEESVAGRRSKPR
jgi:hypothetical protein